MNDKIKNTTKQNDLKLKFQREELKIIQKENLDYLGKKYFLKANENILKHNFKTAFKYIMLGYDSVVCDCALGNWILKDLKKSLLNCKAFNCNIYQLNLIQAYIHWISREYETALNFVNNFIN
jgi:beta-glucosidase/6-phospho-beta-glucosidase/beta-galactosidase